MRLCVGAGYEKLDTREWVTVDLDPHTPVDIHCDVRSLPATWSDTFEEVRAVDILEHLSYRDTVPTLIEWRRVMRSGARLYVQVPAADVMMMDWWYDDRNDRLDRGLPDEMAGEPVMRKLAWRLLGGHYDGQFTRASDQWYLNAHHALFDEETIRWAAAGAGLRVDSIEVNPHPNYCVWLRKP